MSSLVQGLKRHWAIILVMAILMGTEYVGQRTTNFILKYRSYSRSKGSYSPLAVRGLPVGHRQDEVRWLAMACRWAGRKADGNAYEYRHNPLPAPVVTIGGIGLCIRLFGPESADRLLRVLILGLVPFSIYLVVFTASRGRLLALVSAVLVPTGSNILQSFPPVSGEIDLYKLVSTMFVPEASFPVNLSRLPSNGITFPLLMCSVVTLAWALQRRTAKAVIASGVLLGAQAMIYPYFATSLAPGLLLLLLWLIFRREWGTAKALVATCVVALIAAIPAVLQQWQFAQSRYYPDYVNVVFTHTTAWDSSAIAYLATVAILWTLGSFVPGEWQRTYHLILATIAGAALCLNLQVITGIDMQHTHWVKRVITPLLALALCLFIGMATRRLVLRTDRTHWWVVISPVIAAIMVTFGVTKTVLACMERARSWADLEYLPFDDQKAYAWLDAHAPGSVVLSLDPEQITLLPLCAQTYSYLPERVTSSVPYREVAVRWVTACRYYGMSSSTFDSLIAGTNKVYPDAPPEDWQEEPPWWFERSTIHETLFHGQFRPVGVQVPYTLPESVQTSLKQLFRSTVDPDSAIRTFRVDYIWQGPYERAVGIDSLNAQRRVKLIFESGRVRLYRVQPRDQGDADHPAL